MVEAEEYLRRAEHAVTMMERETDPKARAVFERAAKAWLHMAELRTQRLLRDRPATEEPEKIVRFPRDEG